MTELTKYEVILRVRKEDGSIDHQWTMVFSAEDFAHAEEQALIVLKDNEDNDSKIERIEIW
jgi:hypothetical protein